MTGKAPGSYWNFLTADIRSAGTGNSPFYLMQARSSLNVGEALRQATHDPDPNVAAAAESSLRERHVD